MGRAIQNWLRDYMEADRGAVPDEVLNTRIEAMGEVFEIIQRGALSTVEQSQLKEAMTTAQFAVYFGDALSRSFYADYPMAIGAWGTYTTPDITPDFRDVDRGRMTEPGGLVQRRELANAVHTHVEDSWQSWGVDEFARAFSISWQTILNDDLGEIQRTPTRMVNAAARWLDQFVSALYDNATVQASLVALGNVFSGTGRLTAANLAIGLNAMLQRTDATGNQIVYKTIYLIIPPILRIQAAVILQSILMQGSTAAGDANVIPQFLGGVIEDPYITTTALATPWYLVAAPAEVPTITVARLNGWPGPVLIQKASNQNIISGTAPGAFALGSYEHGAIEFTVEDVIGGWDDASWVGVTDFRGIYYSSGTTP